MDACILGILLQLKRRRKTTPWAQLTLAHWCESSSLRSAYLGRGGGWGSHGSQWLCGTSPLVTVCCQQLWSLLFVAPEHSLSEGSMVRWVRKPWKSLLLRHTRFLSWNTQDNWWSCSLRHNSVCVCICIYTGCSERGKNSSITWIVLYHNTEVNDSGLSKLFWLLISV